MTRGAPKLITHYALRPTPRPDDVALRTYCGVEDRSSSVPLTSDVIAVVDCLSCLRAHHTMWGNAAKERIVEVKRQRARIAAILNGRPNECAAHDRQIPAALCTCGGVVEGEVPRG